MRHLLFQVKPLELQPPAGLGHTRVAKAGPGEARAPYRARRRVSDVVAVRAHDRLDHDRDTRRARAAAWLEAVLDARLVQRDEHDDDRRVYRLAIVSAPRLAS